MSAAKGVQRWLLGLLPLGAGDGGWYGMVGDGALLCVYAVDASMSIEIMGYEHSPCDIALLS